MREEAYRALESVYAELADDLRRLGPVCWATGNCCRFERSGHRLYTTPIEFAYLRERTGFAGADASHIEQGTCPFLRDGRCGVRDHRMLGCRIYYCDPKFQPHMAEVYEKYHERVKQVMREHGIAYEYFEFLRRVKDALTC